WSGNTVYFTSDRERTLNIYAYDLTSKAVRKVTSFTEYDVLWPSLGPGAIVFMNGGYLYRLSLATEKVERIPIALGAAIDATAPQFKEVKANVGRADLSPSGARAVIEARGEV